MMQVGTFKPQRGYYDPGKDGNPAGVLNKRVPQSDFTNGAAALALVLPARLLSPPPISFFSVSMEAAPQRENTIPWMLV